MGQMQAKFNGENTQQNKPISAEDQEIARRGSTIKAQVNSVLSNLSEQAKREKDLEAKLRIAEAARRREREEQDK